MPEDEATNPVSTFQVQAIIAALVIASILAISGLIYFYDSTEPAQEMLDTQENVPLIQLPEAMIIIDDVHDLDGFIEEAAPPSEETPILPLDEVVGTTPED